MKSINLPPKAFHLISATRHIGYSLESAVADLVDNSIAANAQTVYINFGQKPSPYLVIIDDGCGMSSKELEHAMQYGSADPNQNRSENDLGRYGLGLKTASMSQCKKLTVFSKKSNETTACRWDLQYIESHKDEVWPLLILDKNEWESLPGVDTVIEKNNGTAVIWDEIDFGGVFDENTFDEVMSRMSEHLALVFHRYIHGEKGIKKLKIIVNDNEIDPKDPFLQYETAGKHGHQCKATQPIGKGKDKIYLEAFTLPHDKELSDKMRRKLGTGKTLKRTQGFYIYRNKRLVTYGNWFGLKAQGEFFKLARVKVDIPNSLDTAWSLDVKKSIAIPPKLIIDGLHAYVDSVVQDSKKAIRVQALGRKGLTDPAKIQVWESTSIDGQITSVFLNRNHPVIKEALETGGLSEKLLTLLERTIPVDIIYYSRSSEQKIDNELPLSIEELVELLKQFVSTVPSGAPRKEYLRLSLMSEPFVMYADELIKYESEILNDTI